MLVVLVLRRHRIRRVTARAPVLRKPCALIVSPEARGLARVVRPRVDKTVLEPLATSAQLTASRLWGPLIVLARMVRRLRRVLQMILRVWPVMVVST